MALSIVDELLKSGILPDITNPEVKSYLIKYLIALIGLAITGVVIYKSTFNPESKTSADFYKYMIISILPIVVGALLISPVFSKPLDQGGMFFYGVLAVVVILAIYGFQHSLNPSSVKYVTYGLNVIGIIAFIIGLAIVYRIFVRSIINARGWGGFVLKVLFYLPCIFIDLLETLFVELKNSPKMVVVLFVLEIAAILAYLYLPKLIHVAVPSNSQTLLAKPAFLTQSLTIAQGKDLVMPINDVNNPGNSDAAFRSNFAISMWVYINQQPSSYAAYSKETDIFRYGFVLTEMGHPRVTYFNDVKNGKPDQCIIYTSNKGNKGIITTQLTGQTWNNLVINYNDSSVELFVNGNLVQSVALSSDEFPQFDLADVIQVGSGDNTAVNGGLMGAICNVKYHHRALIPFEIAAAYNLKRYTNPPVEN